MKQSEKRQYKRVDMVTQVTHVSAEVNQYYYSRDLSLGGIFLETRKPYPTGTRVELHFTLPGHSERVEVEAEVVRTVAPDPKDRNLAPGMGISFIGMSGESREMLRSFLEQE